jgi:hypothetical protein
MTMPFLRSTLLLSALFAALAASGPAGAAALTAGGGDAGVELEICRLPGSLSEYSGKEISIPAGTTFTDEVFDLGGAAERSAPINVMTTAPAALAASAFCVRVPVKPVTPADGAALSQSFGHMFVAGGTSAVRAGRVFDRVYGLLRSGSG